MSVNLEFPDLEESQYDVVLISTGLVESILAGACARIGKKVLHFDHNDFYGTQYGNFSLAALERYAAQQTNVLSSSKSEQSTQQQQQQQQHQDSRFVLPTDPSPVLANYIATTPLSQSSDEMKSEAGRYNIDLVPKIQLSTNAAVRTVVNSAVARYVEFKCIDQSFLYRDNDFQLVPCTKSDLFKNNYIGLIDEKRCLNKFLAFVRTYLEQHVNNKAPESVATKSESNENEGSGAAKEPPAIAIDDHQTFVELLKQHELNDKLIAFVLYTIAYATEDIAKCKLTARDGMQRLSVYLQSLGRYGPSPFICVLYGFSEFCQAFCRLAAVYGGTYMLRTQPTHLALESGKVVGVVDKNAKLLKCSNVVTSSTYLPSLSRSNQSIARAFVISSQPLKESGPAVVFVIPPNSFDNEHAIQILQLDHEMFATPKGKYLIQFMTLTNGIKTAQQVLSPVLSHFFKSMTNNNSSPNTSNTSEKFEAPESDQTTVNESKSNVENNNGNVLYSAYFDMPLRSIDASRLPGNLYCASDAEASLDSDNAVHEAERLFRAMFPGDEFLPRAPNPEDIVWESNNNDGAGES